MIDKVSLLITAMRDNRTPWLAKLFVVFILAYIISPIDIIPDFIPVLGLLDEAILIPIALAVVFKMIPEPVKEKHNEELDDTTKRKLKFVGSLSILTIWLFMISVTYYLLI